MYNLVKTFIGEFIHLVTSFVYITSSPFKSWSFSWSLLTPRVLSSRWRRSISFYLWLRSLRFSTIKAFGIGGMEYLHGGLCEKVKILLVALCQGNWRETPSPVHLMQEGTLNSAGNRLFFFRFTADGLVTSEGDKWNFSLEPFTLCKWMTTFQSLFYELRIKSGLIFSALGLNSYLVDVFYIAYHSYQINVDIQENLSSKKTHFCILLKTFNLFYTMRCFVLLLIEIERKGQYTVKK